MPLPRGTIPATGPFIDTSGALLTASTALRDAGAVSLRGGKLQKVNAAGNGWEDVPGHVIAATAPTEGLFVGLLWYNTTNNTPNFYNGTAFISIAGVATDALRHRGVYDSSVTDYVLSNVVSTGSVDLYAFWIVGNATLANLNAPSISVAAEDSGWELLTEEHHWRGVPPVSSQLYHAGDEVFINPDVYHCLVAGDYERAHIPVSVNWINLTATDRLLPALPQPGNRDVVTSASGTTYELAPHVNLDDIFPRVAALPDHTAEDAPAFVYLDHSITEGTREDANMTIGEAAGFYGYSRLPPAFGSINKTSPIGQLVGQATANSITEIWSTNAAWLGQFTHILLGGTEYALVDSYQSGPWHIRNITDPPTAITALTLNINLKKTDNSYFFQGPGHLTLFNEGWYELLSTGYSRIASSGYVHTNGQGSPTGPPIFEGQRFVNEFGQEWVAGGERARITVEAAGTDVLFAHDEYNREFITIQQNFNRSGDGGFSWDPRVEAIGSFYQFRGPLVTNLVYGLTWNEVWTYITELTGGDTAENIRLRDHSVFLGGHNALDDALHELSQRVTQEVYDLGATDYYYGKSGGSGLTRGVRDILTYTAATTVITNDLFWRGPLFDENDTQDLIDKTEVVINGTAAVDQGNANQVSVGKETWGTRPIQDRRVAGLPTASAVTLENLFEDTRGVWRGRSFIEEETDGRGTFTDVAFGGVINRFIGIFGRLTGLQSLYPASGRANGDFAIVNHAPNPGFYSALNGHWILAHTDAEVQALLDTLSTNSADYSRYWGWHGNDILAMHRKGAIELDSETPDGYKQYYYFNYNSASLRKLSPTTYIAGTEAGDIGYEFQLVVPASGVTERVLYETAATGVSVAATTALLAGNIVCPATGHIEVYMEQITGDRKGSIAQTTIPAARLRTHIAAVGTAHGNDNINLMTIPHAENQSVGIACITDTFYIMLTAQSAGTFYIHIAHRQ